MRHEIEHFRVGDQLKARIDNFRTPRGLPRHVALRCLLNAGLRIIEQGGDIDLHDPLKAYPSGHRARTTRPAA
jgi:hypothetical protein